MVSSLVVLDVSEVLVELVEAAAAVEEELVAAEVAEVAAVVLSLLPVEVELVPVVLAAVAWNSASSAWRNSSKSESNWLELVEEESVSVEEVVPDVEAEEAESPEISMVSTMEFEMLVHVELPREEVVKEPVEVLCESSCKRVR